MGELLDDLAAETASLEELLKPLSAADWERPTPAAGWAIRDQISHLAWFDDAASLAASDPVAYAELLAGFSSVDAVAAEARTLPATEVHAWFRTSRANCLRVCSTLDAKTRVPWFWLEMSAASFVTARLMETWAHGQDVADALGVTRAPTARLRHVASIGYRAKPYGFAVRRLPEPPQPVRVELTMPDGGPWTAGPAGAADVVRGPMLDFCLVVTQRVHLADTALEITGPAARAWMEIAQAFAGDPGEGRKPRSDR
ncbi:TIGR03084 family protein [Nonomuraea sp. NN258]|uniref:TIGR03084 family metal-binding protein n=1 Tax=Nonomuraea antri TaxID=2730852 RepID=UPI00156A5544|nr:TIGR03084 family metal-binding protein [Nonomuraea antri]NRQ30524.1 TIGR03084 family protein [Nonomuraea antri]